MDTGEAALRSTLRGMRGGTRSADPSIHSGRVSGAGHHAERLQLTIEQVLTTHAYVDSAGEQIELGQKDVTLIQSVSADE